MHVIFYMIISFYLEAVKMLKDTMKRKKKRKADLIEVSNRAWDNFEKRFMDHLSVSKGGIENIIAPLWLLM